MRVRACADEEVVAARQRGIRRGLLAAMDGIIDLDAVQRRVREHLFDERRDEAQKLPPTPPPKRPYGPRPPCARPRPLAQQGGQLHALAPPPAPGARPGPTPP